MCGSLCDAANANCWTKMDCAGAAFVEAAGGQQCSGAKAGVGFHQSVEFVWIALFLAASSASCFGIVCSRRLLRYLCMKPPPPPPAFAPPPQFRWVRFSAEQSVPVRSSHGGTHTRTRRLRRPPRRDSQRKILSKSWERVTSPTEL